MQKNDSGIEHEGECPGRWLLIRIDGVDSWLCSECGRSAPATLVGSGAVHREWQLEAMLDRLATEGAGLLWREDDRS